MFHARLPYDHSRRNSVAGSTILRVRRNPSQTFWTAGRLRRGPVRIPLSQRRSPRFPPACAPCLRCHATGLAPDTVLRRSTPFDEGLRPSAEDRVALRPALRRIPSPGGQRPSMRGCAALRPALRRIPLSGGQRPSKVSCAHRQSSCPHRRGSYAALRPALRRIPSPGGQRPSMRGCALRRRTAWYCDRPYAGYRRPAVNALRRGSCAALRPALFDLPCPYPIAFQTLPKQP